MREIVREVELPVPAERAFALLITPSAIRAWWQAARVIVVPRHGGTWAAAWGEAEDAPDHVTVATISVYEPPQRLRLRRYQYLGRDREGPPFASDLETDFRVHPTSGGSRLTVQQTGFPDDASADEFLATCERGWQDTLRALERVSETLGGR